MLHYPDGSHLSIIAAVADHGHGVVDVLAAVSVGVVAASLVLIDAARVVKHEGSLRIGIVK